MLSPRWIKVTRDLTYNLTRTVLTLLTVAVGVFAVGFVSSTGAILIPDMNADYQSSSPAGARLYTEQFDSDLVHSVRQTPGIAQAEGRSTLTARLALDAGRKISFQIDSIPNPLEMQVSILKPVDRTLPTLASHQILIDHSAASLPLQPGDSLQFEMPGGNTRQLIFGGFVHDVNTIPYGMSGQASGYVSPDTMEWLGGSKKYNEMLIAVSENKTDRAHVSDMAQAVAHRMERSGVTIHTKFIYNPGRHFAYDITQAVIVILTILGWLSVFLSAFLVINTVNALIAQQVRTIGVMKAIGGRMGQILVMYLALVFSLGIMAYLVAAPLASVLAYQVCIFLSGFLNFQLASFRVIPQALIQQAAVALGVPLAAAFIPVLHGARITIREAISQYGLAAGPVRQGLFDRLTAKIRFLPRPILLSLRNTFRRKARLFLNLSTLTLAGAIFIAIFNLWAGMDGLMEQIKGYLLADINVSFSRSYRIEELEGLVLSLPGVASMEGWGAASGQLLSPDGKTLTELTFVAPPAQTRLIRPVITAGRWLQPADDNALVVGNHLLKQRPDLKLGDNIIIRLQDKDTVWHIVGFYRIGGNFPTPPVYANYEYLQQVLNRTGEVTNLRVTTLRHDAGAQSAVAQAFQARFQQAGIFVSQMTTGSEWIAQQKSSTDLLVYFMLIMALLIALVGGLGLMGTMTINVMERTREIGVMRSIGARSQTIQGIVLVEGLVVAFMSWCLAVFLSIPLTMALDYGVGASMFNTPLDFTFGIKGLVFWLGLVLILAGLASALPAWRASRLTIRETLAYE